MIRVISKDEESLEEVEEEQLAESSPTDIEEDDQPKTPEVEERRTIQPSTPIPPENGMIGSQMIFEDLHEQSVYDTIEEKLSNLIDIEPEGENETKKMSITLEKSMTFNFNVHASTPQVVETVKDATKELKDHFEKTLKYNVETILEDSEELSEETSGMQTFKFWPPE